MNKSEFETLEKLPAEEHFFEKGFEKAHTVVFFIDEGKRRIGMLQRSEKLDFAPNLYAGVGGKIEPHEGHREGAVRELGEELKEGEGGFGKEKIKEFGRIIINGKAIIAYFALPYKSDELPVTEKDIGALRWTSFEGVSDLEIIPTTKIFMEEWKNRDWDIHRPFTVVMKRDDAKDIHSPVSSVEVKEGLIGEALD